jgi:hypothetical protein
MRRLTALSAAVAAGLAASSAARADDLPPPPGAKISCGFNKADSNLVGGITLHPAWTANGPGFRGAMHDNFIGADVTCLREESSSKVVCAGLWRPLEPVFLTLTPSADGKSYALDLQKRPTFYGGTEERDLTCVVH